MLQNGCNESVGKAIPLTTNHSVNSISLQTLCFNNNVNCFRIENIWSKNHAWKQPAHRCLTTYYFKQNCSKEFFTWPFQTATLLAYIFSKGFCSLWQIASLILAHKSDQRKAYSLPYHRSVGHVIHFLASPFNFLSKTGVIIRFFLRNVRFVYD